VFGETWNGMCSLHVILSTLRQMPEFKNACNRAQKRISNANRVTEYARVRKDVEVKKLITDHRAEHAKLWKDTELKSLITHHVSIPKFGEAFRVGDSHTLIKYI